MLSSQLQVLVITEGNVVVVAARCNYQLKNWLIAFISAIVLIAGGVVAATSNYLLIAIIEV